MHVRLLRKSDFNPTRMIGVVGQKCRTSGYHLEDVNIKVTLHLKGFLAAYLVHNILQRSGTVNRKADKQQIRLGV